MADVINFERTENSIDIYDLEELDGLIYEQRIVNPETGEAIVIASGPAKEILSLMMDIKEEIPEYAFDDAFEGIKKYIPKELLE